MRLCIEVDVGLLLVGMRLVKLQWFGPDLVYDAMEKVNCIRGRMKEAQDRQRSYQDNRRRDLEFEFGDLVYLKVSPMKGVVRFGKKGKLSPRYIGPYTILKRVGSVSYERELRNDFAKFHPVFHVSMLWKFIGDVDTIFLWRM